MNELGMTDKCDEWSRQPPVYFKRFRQAMLSGAIGNVASLGKKSPNVEAHERQAPLSPAPSSVLNVPLPQSVFTPFMHTALRRHLHTKRRKRCL